MKETYYTMMRMHVHIVEPSPVYSLLCGFPEVDMSRTTIYDQEMSDG